MTRTSPLPWSFLAIFPLLSVCVVAQQTFRVGTLLVEVDAIVTDASGRFVTGLTPDDFEVFEEGQPQTIERMFLVYGRTMSAVRPPSPVPEAGRAQTDVDHRAPPRVFVLFFDEQHLQQSSLKRLKEAAERFLKTEFQQDDVGGVLIGAKMAGNRLTSDREALLGAVRELKIVASEAIRKSDLTEWPRMTEAEAIRIVLQSDERVLAQVADRAKRETSEGNLPNAQSVDYRDPVELKARRIVDALRPAAAQTTGALRALLNGLARFPGQKNVVLITDGFFVDESWAQLRQLVGLAARANTRIYSIDAEGMSRRMPNVDPGTLLMPLETGGAIPTEGFDNVEEGPNTLAVDTGGYAFRHSNDFGSAFAGIAQDASRYYVLGYTPALPASDGSFRRITVRVKRPGLTVRARRGYLATAPQMVASAAAEPTTAPAAPTPESSPSAANEAESSSVAEGNEPVPAPPAAPAPPVHPAPPALPAARLRPDAGARVLDLASRGGGVERADSNASHGWDRYQSGDLETAAELLGKAAADPNARPWVQYAFGYSALALHRLTAAAEAWEKVRASVPEFRNVYLDLADVYMQLQDFGRGIEVLRIADRRWPGDADVLNAMGTIQVRRGALDDAIATFRRATDAKSQDGVAWFNLGRTYELRYFKTRRYLTNEARWFANASDLRGAIASYQEYLKHGGPYENQARDAVQKLEWLR